MTAETGNLIGKRYRCAICDTEVICVKSGGGQLSCHGEVLALLEPKALPSTD